MDPATIMAIATAGAGVISGLIAVAGLVAEKTKNTTDDQIVKWARMIWSLIPIGQMDPKKMGKK